MTTTELRDNQILCMLKIKAEDYNAEELKTIVDIGQIWYNSKEIQNLLRYANIRQMD